MITEGGIITFSALFLGFVVKCCQQMEQSRCTKCKCFSCNGCLNGNPKGCECSIFDCDRNPLTKEEIEAHKFIDVEVGELSRDGPIGPNGPIGGIKKGKDNVPKK